MADADPTLKLKDLIKDNWDNTNTSISYDPEIHTGWYDKQATKPQVTFTNLSEESVNPAGGGTTPFFGIDPSGKGPFSMFRGDIQADCWSDREVESDVNPKKLSYEFSEEIKRIARENTTNVQDTLYIGYDGRNFMVESDGEPTVFRYRVLVQYGYIDEP